MKKWIAILFLALICCTTAGSMASFSDSICKQWSDTDDNKKNLAEEKKEVKEYTLHSFYRHYHFVILGFNYSKHSLHIFPHPVIDTQTPPPDPAC